MGDTLRETPASPLWRSLELADLQDLVGICPQPQIVPPGPHDLAHHTCCGGQGISESSLH